MMKQLNERQFEQKEKFLYDKRINAMKILKQQGFCLAGETEFLNNIEKKNYMTREERVEFNQKNCQFYSKLQMQYKKCLKNKKLQKYNKRGNQKAHESVNIKKQLE